MRNSRNGKREIKFRLFPFTFLFTTLFYHLKLKIKLQKKIIGEKVLFFKSINGHQKISKNGRSTFAENSNFENFRLWTWTGIRVNRYWRIHILDSLLFEVTLSYFWPRNNKVWMMVYEVQWLECWWSSGENFNFAS